MPLFNRKSPWEKEWERLRKREEQFLEQQSRREPVFQKMKWREKIPANLQATVQKAFVQAFRLLFEKGSGWIEKSYSVEEKNKAYLLRDYENKLRQNRKSLRNYEKAAAASSRGNVLLSGGAGIGMGLLGCGLPDIPLFSSFLLKNCYEIALSYGYDYHKEEERWFLLRVMELALRGGEELPELDGWLNAAIQEDGSLCYGDVEEQLQRTAAALSDAIVAMKFIQGIPIVGVVGGAYDALLLNRISDYARLKYQRRLLLRKKWEHG